MGLVLENKSILLLKHKGEYRTSQRLGKDNTYDVLKTRHVSTPLTATFFSEYNVNSIQNLLKMLVHQELGVVIDKQSVDDVLNRMGAVFTIHARHPRDFSTSMSGTELAELKVMYTREVMRLNELVVKQLLPGIVSEVQGQVKYLEEIYSPTKVMDRPISASSTGLKNVAP